MDVYSVQAIPVCCFTGSIFTLPLSPIVAVEIAVTNGF